MSTVKNNPVFRAKFRNPVRCGTAEIESWIADRNAATCEESQRGLLFKFGSEWITIVPYSNVVSYDYEQ